MEPLVFVAPQSAYMVHCKKVSLSITKDERGSIGCVIRGGAATPRSKSRPLTITHITAGGPAYRWATLDTIL